MRETKRAKIEKETVFARSRGSRLRECSVGAANPSLYTRALYTQLVVVVAHSILGTRSHRESSDFAGNLSRGSCSASAKTSGSWRVSLSLSVPTSALASPILFCSLSRSRLFLLRRGYDFLFLRSARDLSSIVLLSLRCARRLGYYCDYPRIISPDFLHAESREMVFRPGWRWRPRAVKLIFSLRPVISFPFFYSARLYRGHARFLSFYNTLAGVKSTTASGDYVRFNSAVQDFLERERERLLSQVLDNTYTVGLFHRNIACYARKAFPLTRAGSFRARCVLLYILHA